MFKVLIWWIGAWCGWFNEWSGFESSSWRLGAPVWRCLQTCVRLTGVWHCQTTGTCQFTPFKSRSLSSPLPKSTFHILLSSSIPRIKVWCRSIRPICQFNLFDFSHSLCISQTISLLSPLAFPSLSLLLYHQSCLFPPTSHAPHSRLYRWFIASPLPVWSVTYSPSIVSVRSGSVRDNQDSCCPLYDQVSQLLQLCVCRSRYRSLNRSIRQTKSIASIDGAYYI